MRCRACRRIESVDRRDGRFAGCFPTGGDGKNTNVEHPCVAAHRRADSDRVLDAGLRFLRAATIRDLIRATATSFRLPPGCRSKPARSAECDAAALSVTSFTTVA